MADAKPVVPPSPVESTPGGTPVEAQTPAQIDSRRAQQLLERALILSEHGDAPAAILACRQAITLSPEAPQGYSMLGLLLERADDNSGAIAAYEKVLQIDPGSVLERESLARLRAAAARRRTARDMFAFDEGELFDERRKNTAVTGVSPADTATRDDLDGHGAKPTAVTGVFPRSVTPAKASVSANAPVAAPLSPSVAVAPSSTFLHPTAYPAGKLGTVLPALEEFGTPPTLWQRMVARPSYYFRGMPLAATAIAGLCFLLWARHYAISQETTAALSGAGTTTVIQDGGQAVVVPQTDTAINPAAPPAPVNPATSTPGATATPNGAAGGVPVNPGGAAPSAPPPRSAASTPAASPAPVPSTPSPRAPAIAPAPPRASSGGANDGGAMPDLPRPRLGGSDNNNTEPTRVLPPENEDSGAVSSGGSPLNPGGSPNRDFTRVAPTGSRTTAPSRPDARAARDERSAISGNPGAVAAVTRAIETGGGDTAVRYQQRAQLYLDSGDTTRAINDFQTAISAYNDMIARGDRVAVARAGIQASQRGIQVARARARR